ncbi:MAG: relaxase/mobilization nuclease domain-containing protein [Eggerthellaceae bacterium]|nr:relaxase/mobilization nuclease domain-containing protein [Eggerthellaceae bacterium]MBQ9044185.1 relaxase/mobilization nuclease domain-containing protein [Eggerthellaceae bacterium]
MTVLQSISGHTNLRATKDYLELGKGKVREYFVGNDGDRCLAKDFLNFSSAREEEMWDTVMDEVRAVNGNDAPHHGKPAVTFRHFILSPSPRDECNLSKLRELARRWADELFGINGSFGMYHVGIFYHNDNSERASRGWPGIPHAHIVVNNTNLKTGNRLHFSDRDTHYIGQRLEEISHELGLSYFTVDRIEREDGTIIHERTHHEARVVEVGDEYISKYEVRYDSRPSAQKIYETKAEREIRRKGQVSWKEELRQGIDIAINLSKNFEELRANLEAMGVHTEERSGRRNRGQDLIFYYPQKNVAHEDNKKRCGGMRLGHEYTNNRLIGRMKLAYYQSLFPEDRDEKRIIDLVSNVYVVGVTDKNKVVLRDLSKAFSAINGSQIHTIQEAQERLDEYTKRVSFGDPNDRRYDGFRKQIDNIQALLRVAEYTNILPENDRWAATPPKDIQRRREENQAFVTNTKYDLKTKVNRGLRLTREEHAKLKRENPSEFRRWQRNYAYAHQGKKLEPEHTGGGSSGGGSRPPSHSRSTQSAQRNRAR